jgi:hypothetical protein
MGDGHELGFAPAIFAKLLDAERHAHQILEAFLPARGCAKLL